jgi:hypothetical protein
MIIVIQDPCPYSMEFLLPFTMSSIPYSWSLARNKGDNAHMIPL